jgi:hypothetical protein
MNTREIDKLIAEKFMGWELSLYGGIPSWRTEKIGTAYRFIDIDCTPNYSTDIKDAWLVVDKMDMSEIIKTSETKFTCYTYVESKYGVEGFEGKAETAPMAICLAALDSVKEE